MTKAEILKKEILSRFKSIRAFCIELDIPYSTLVTALERGIEGMAYGTVIKMCERLSLDPIDFSSLDNSGARSRKLYEKKLINSFERLNREGRRKMFELMDDFALIEKYTE